jgi:hypothetical protein
MSCSYKIVVMALASAVIPDGFWPHAHVACLLALAVAFEARRRSSCTARTAWRRPHVGDVASLSAREMAREPLAQMVRPHLRPFPRRPVAH